MLDQHLQPNEKPSYYSTQLLATKHFSWYTSPIVVADQQQHINESERLFTQYSERAVLYWSLAEPAGLVLGFSQKHETLNPAVLTGEQRIPLYRRRAGGTAVLVGPQLLSLDVFLPAGHPLILPDVVESYRWFGEVWVTALQAIGVQTRLVSVAEAHAQRVLLKQPETQEHERLLHRACYGTLSSYEVVSGQRKVVGLDMIRRRSGTLLQAGVLLHWDTSLLAYLLGHTEEEQSQLHTGLRERAIGLDELVSRKVKIEEIKAIFEDALLLL